MDVSRSAPAEILQAWQAYAWVRSEPYRRRDDFETVLHVYRSGCARCGEPFEVKISPAGHPSLKVVDLSSTLANWAGQ